MYCTVRKRKIDRECCLKVELYLHLLECIAMYFVLPIIWLSKRRCFENSNVGSFFKMETL